MRFLFIIFMFGMLVITLLQVKKSSTAIKQLKQVQIIGNSQLTTDEIEEQQFYLKQHKMGWTLKAPTILTIVTTVMLVAIGYIVKDAFSNSNANIYMAFVGIIIAVANFGKTFTTSQSYKMKAKYVQANPDNPLKMFVEPEEVIDKYRSTTTRMVVSLLVMSISLVIQGIM